MKNIKLSKKTIIIATTIVFVLVAIFIALIATNVIMPGSKMNRLENNPSFNVEVAVDNMTLNIRINNNSDNYYMYGYEFALYRRIGWHWRRVSFADDIMWRSLGFDLKPNSYSYRPAIDLYNYFGNLSAGTYRIIIPAHNIESREEVRLAGSFVLE